MSYFRECPWCGGHLDPGEICDCREEEEDTKKDPPGPGQVDKNTTKR